MENGYPAEAGHARMGIFIQIIPQLFHKLKNKLTPIMGYTQILINKCEEDEIRKRLNKIERNALDLSDLMDQLKNASPDYETQKAFCSINTVALRAIPYLKSRAEPVSITIQPELSGAVSEDMLDQGQLIVLIIELVENALTAYAETRKEASQERAASGQGRITITTLPETDGYSLRIRDDGPGICEEDLPRIWTPFFSRFTDHLGLGLLVCEQIAENHQASFQVYSQPGEGTEVALFFKK